MLYYFLSKKYRYGVWRQTEVTLPDVPQVTLPDVPQVTLPDVPQVTLPDVPQVRQVGP